MIVKQKQKQKMCLTMIIHEAGFQTFQHDCFVMNGCENECALLKVLAVEVVCIVE